MKKVVLSFVSFLGFILAIPQIKPVEAHPQPVVVQEFEMVYGTDSVGIEYKLHIDPIVLDDVYKEIDIDNNDEISNDELEKFSESIVIKHMTVRVNNRESILKKTDSVQPAKKELLSLDDYIGISYTIENPVLYETNSLYFKYDKKFVPDDEYGDLIPFMDNIAENPDKFERISTNQDMSIAPIDYLVDYKILNFGKEPVSSTISPHQQRKPKRNWFKEFISTLSTKSTELTNQARNYNFKQGGFKLFLISLIITMLAGALHAITPGHGKSLMAAFLIGKQKSKVIDVLILGLSITLAHTIVIYIIGFTLWGLNMTSSATKITYYVEKASSVLLIILAIIMARSAYKAYQHHLWHKNHGISEDDTLIHDHGFGPHSHAPKNMSIRNRWDLFYAGISGGMVPCLDALSILFVAVNIGKVGIGLVLIFFFSLGLAIAIILMGLLLIFGRDKLHLEQRFGPLAQYYAPIFSAFVIFIIASIYLFKK